MRRGVQPTALCLQCGASKALALTRCSACDYAPQTDVDRARHVLVLDLDASAQARLAAQIRAGEPFETDEETLAEAVRAVRAAGPGSVAMVALLAVTPVMVLLGAVAVVAAVLSAL